MKFSAALAWSLIGCSPEPERSDGPGEPTADSPAPTGPTGPTGDTATTGVDAGVSLAFVHDPSGYSPLAGELTATAQVPVTVELRVPGDHGAASDVTYVTPTAATDHVVPVLGLYPDRTQQVEVVVRDATGGVVHEQTFSVTTPPLSEAVHDDIEVSVADFDQMTPGFTLVSAFGRGYGHGANPQRPMMFDAFGDVRWTLSFVGHPQLSGLFYDVGMERLANGNLYFGDSSTAAIYEVDMLGRVIDTWPIDPYDFHHNVQELANGNFLVTGSLRGADTVEDQVLEIDRTTKEILNTWDLRQSLDPTRDTWSGQLYDWAHVNAVQEDPVDDTIVISGRTQGVVKLTRDNEVVWILAPHVDWDTAGDGTDLSTKLLQPLDAAGEPITDPAVLRGQSAHPDFDWNWTQHAVQVVGGGDIAIFDNGVDRNFQGAGPYSRAVRFHVDDVAMTVQQVWEYGESRGATMYSEIVSDVDVLPNGHVIWSPGAVATDAGPYGAVIELDADDEVVFEARIWSTGPTFGITFHRTERLTLYP
ncbi:MAG: aryl-sulfate sulfotransferase [Myxococcota bacterium]